MQKKTQKVLMAAGGTGGHIMPSLAIAAALKASADDYEVEFVHGGRALEKKIYSRFEFKTYILPVGRLRKNVGLIERVRAFMSLPVVLFKALYLIRKVNPALVFGSGGAVSGPVVLAGFLLKKKTMIFEPNVIPGLANRWVSKVVDQIVVVFSETKKYFKESKTTQRTFPVRLEIQSISVKERPSHPVRVLVLGGSQGSYILNNVVSEFIVSDPSLKYSFVHQTGERDFTRLKQKYSSYEHVKVYPFLHDIHSFYDWSDIVISRSGAGVIAELSASGRMGIFIPLAHSAGGHQIKNAHSIYKNKAGLYIKEKHLTTEVLCHRLNNLSSSDIKYFSSAMKSLQLGGSADNISSLIRKKLADSKSEKS